MRVRVCIYISIHPSVVFYRHCYNYCCYCKLSWFSTNAQHSYHDKTGAIEPVSQRPRVSLPSPLLPLGWLTRILRSYKGNDTISEIIIRPSDIASPYRLLSSFLCDCEELKKKRCGLHAFLLHSCEAWVSACLNRSFGSSDLTRTSRNISAAVIKIAFKMVCRDWPFLISCDSQELHLSFWWWPPLWPVLPSTTCYPLMFSREQGASPQTLTRWSKNKQRLENFEES